uniref:Xylose isomerase-like TIM barrel domain-containing protein n=1 Tax=Hemiselmis andersenii TaxID=464988 RepID=A0A6T8MTK1_HEMAN
MKLSMMGFCGADDSVDPRLLAAISARYDWVEWGVLFRDDKQGQPRFATFEWIEDLKTVNEDKRMGLAGHLCSKYAIDLLKGDASFVRKMHEEHGFTRFQLNATAANNVDSSQLGAEGADALRRVAEELPGCEFILQANDETEVLWKPLLASSPPANLSFLFDESKGLGVVAASYPPPPPEGVRFGYTGGLGPKNIGVQMGKMQSAAGDREIWVDMESSLRTKLEGGQDIFDVYKAMACIRVAIEMGLKPGK